MIRRLICNVLMRIAIRLMNGSGSVFADHYHSRLLETPTELVNATGSMMKLNAIGRSGVARPLGDLGEIGRFAHRGDFTSWNGTAPTEASSRWWHRRRNTWRADSNGRRNGQLCGQGDTQQGSSAAAPLGLVQGNGGHAATVRRQTAPGSR